MKTMNYVLLIIFTLIGLMSSAQTLPRKSQKATIKQQIGLTEITINYSRPNVNGRTIFGDLVPYNEVWRLGANEPTKMSVSEPIFINGSKLDTGMYAVFAIPQKNQWKVVFNKDTEQWGAMDYDAGKNVVEYISPVVSTDHTESFEIAISDVEGESANLSFRWATTKVIVPISTDTEAAVMRNINAAIEKGEELEKVYYNAADYFADNGEPKKAKEYLLKSFDVERTYYNTFLGAQIEKELGDEKMMFELANEAKNLAKKAEKQGWVNYIERKQKEWRGE